MFANALSALIEHKPSRWRSFTNNLEVLRCCGQDFGNATRRPRPSDKSPYELWAEHVVANLEVRE